MVIWTALTWTPLQKGATKNNGVLEQEPFINPDMGFLKYPFMAFLNHILNATIKHSVSITAPSGVFMDDLFKAPLDFMM